MVGVKVRLGEDTYMNNSDVAYGLAFAFRFVLIPLILHGIIIWSLSLIGFDTTNSSYGSSSSISFEDDKEGPRRWYAFLLGIAVALLIIVVTLFNGATLSLSLDPTQPFQMDTGAIVVYIGLGLAIGLGSMAISRRLE